MSKLLFHTVNVSSNLKFCSNLCAGFSKFCTAASMVSGKFKTHPKAKKVGKGKGRQPAPEVKQDDLEDQLVAYVNKMGPIQLLISRCISPCRRQRQ